ncbi:MAG: immunoglobulin domain-containing protein, partial [Phaeodactylibacter sp.]|nr:immunoglobulin domain-containing protein [Phaeodactylibacter sp.]
TAAVGSQLIPGEDILLWTDTLVQFFAPIDWIGTGEAIVISSSEGTDSIPGAFLFTPRIQYVSGEVSGVWTKDCPGIYMLTGDVIVPEGQSLRIEPGVQVLVDTDSTSNALFQVLGTLIAEGTETDSILFSALPYQRMPGAWTGIELDMQSSTDSATLSRCIVEYARTGITGRDSEVAIDHCTVRNNSESGVHWLALEETALGRLANSSIRDNNGYGVQVSAFGNRFGNASARPELLQNQIENNSQGGIFIESRTATPPNFTSGPSSRGASATPIINGNSIRNNNGYGIECLADGDWANGVPFDFFYRAYAHPSMENNLIVDNNGGFKAITQPTGGGTWLSYSEPRIINNTFYNNGPTAIHAGDSTKITVANSIFRGEENASIEYEGSGKTFISYSNFPELQPGPGNISADPLFSDPGNNDFRLLASSPAIDAGNNDAATEPTDFAGAPRIADGNGDGTATVDMGAYEYHLPEITLQPDPSQELCEGETATLSVSAEGDGLAYQWQQDGQDIPGANAAELSFDSAQPDNNGSYTCVITDELGGSVQTTAAQLTVLPFFDVTVQVEASATAGCQGEAVVFTATPTDAGTDPQFEWQVNGQPAGENSATFTATGLDDEDRVVCILTSREVCTANNPAVSDEIVVEVHPLPQVALEPPEPLCADEPAFELNIATLPGGVYSGPGVSNNHFDPAAAGPGMHDISYAYTDTLTGCTSIEMTVIRVLEVVEAGISVSSSAESYCAGDDILLAATPSHPGDSPTYQWTVNGEAAGGNSPELSLPGEPGAYEVACTLLSSAACALNNPAMSNVVSLEVHALPIIDPFGPESVCVNAGVLELDATPTGGIYEGPGVAGNLFDPAVAGVGAHTISYAYTDPQTGCTGTGNADIVVREAVEVGLQVIGETTNLCAGDGILLTGTAVHGGGNPVWEWTLNGEIVSTGPDLELFNHDAGDYELACTFTSSEQCTTNGPTVSFAVSFTVYPLPEVTLTLPDTVDSATGPVELTGGFPAGGIYDGPGVMEDSGVFIFDPVAAGGGFHSITYTYTAGNGCSATATAETLVGLDQPAAGIRLQVFPNPSTGLFHLRADQPAAGWVVSVFNLQGRKVWEEAWLNPAGGEQEVDLRSMPKGAYLLRVTDGKRRLVRRLVVQ